LTPAVAGRVPIIAACRTFSLLVQQAWSPVGRSHMLPPGKWSAGSDSRDNWLVLTMEWVAEALAMWFVSLWRRPSLADELPLPCTGCVLVLVVLAPGRRWDRAR
jgi:hypothetical protein